MQTVLSFIGGSYVLKQFNVSISKPQSLVGLNVSYGTMYKRMLPCMKETNAKTSEKNETFWVADVKSTVTVRSYEITF